ncbi:MAG: 16S rRNA (cytosine(1402)-N(4))-methyltransferase RsmH [Candidatus Omnitrophica bacterium]|nr:16S rRNA (cytosine(1402)-N(4))-methyltransferase RsmH [Candidatus Omnitrophota bacterium]
MKLSHKPVMLNEVIKYLQPKRGDIIVDCTVGAGGHSYEIAKLILPEGKLIGIDQDREVLNLAQERLRDFKNCTLVHQNFRDINFVLQDLGIAKVDGLLFDLGLSSFQLDDPQRGFSFRSSGYLDMRMDRENSVTAFDLLNNLTSEELEKIFRQYSQERYARRVASAIMRARQEQVIETTIQLANIVKKAIPRRGAIHPATRVFQALRIAVNQELENLSAVLSKAINFLKPKGKICVLSFHSGEDRIVKNEFKKFFQSKTLHLLTKKPIISSKKEISDNPRARSAKLRIGEKI